MAAPLVTLGHLLNFLLGRINMLPRPRILWIQPDFIGAVLAPGSFVEREKSLGRVLVKILAAGDQFDGRLWLGEFARNVSQELRPFKPPMAKKFSIEGRGEDRWHAGRRWILADRFMRDVREVPRMIASALLCPLRMVRLLLAEIDFGP